MSEGGETNPNDVENNGADQPLVFISYSHDSAEHVQWVLRLAERLVSCGVDVKLDHWDLGLGDDVVKYMRKSVTAVDRVLMICTSAYVRKANDGKGGVGYEATVVDGELVRDQGTNKFIPVIRQQAAEPLVPTSVSTRLYVNLSHGSDIEKEFEKLVCNIHDTPKARKPKLGKNPYSISASVTTEDAATVSQQTGELSIESKDAESAYRIGLHVAKSGDFTAWRQVLRQITGPLSKRLTLWRTKYDGASSMEISELPAVVMEGATIYSPLMAVALAGIESGQPKFNNQTAILDELLRPTGWNSSGLVAVGSIPEALAFTYQALHGATCLEIGDLSLAMALSRTRVSRADHFEGVILNTDLEFLGRPESFNHNSTISWKYLVSLPEEWGWLEKIFGSRDEYRVALSAYYMALNIQELAKILASGTSAELGNPHLRLIVPLEWMRMPLEIKQRAYRVLTKSQGEVKSIWRSLDVDYKSMKEAWPLWLEHVVGSASNFNLPSLRGRPAHSFLFEDVRETA